MRNFVALTILSLFIAGCAPVAPYRTSGYFVSPQLARHEGKTIAVLTFRGGASDPVTDIANLEIGRLNRWKLVERIRVQELYNEQDFDPERIDDDMAIKIGKMLGAYTGARISHASANIKKYLGLGLIPQAGVALGCALIAKANFPEVGDIILTTILATTVVYELVGPSCTMFALKKAGEIHN